MTLEREARRDDLAQRSDATGNLVHAIALATAEMVVVTLAAHFVARHLAGELNDIEPALVGQGPNVPVHCGNSQSPDLAPCKFKDFARSERAIRALGEAGIPVSLFIDPNDPAVRASKDLGAPRIELHTGDYCERVNPIDHQPGDAELTRLGDAARLGVKLGLHVAAGHGLDYGNVGPVAAIREITELNIGHAIVARAVLIGMERAVGEMWQAMRRARAAE